MYLVIAASMPEASSFIMDWARQSGVADVDAARPAAAGHAGARQRRLITSLCLFALQSIVLLWGGVMLLSYQLRHGVVRSGARDSARRIAVGSAAQTPVRSMAQAAPHAAASSLAGSSGCSRPYSGANCACSAATATSSCRHWCCRW
jgi:hypothetical protein